MPATSEHHERARRAHVEALASQLYADRRAQLLRIAERNSLNPDDAEEALQEAFIAFLRSYDPERGAHPMAWLTLVLKRGCWERTRREHLDRRLGQEADLSAGEVGSALELIPDSANGPQETALLGEQTAEVREQLAQLKPQERRALGLLALGYSYKEIMEITGWSYTKINRCIAEGRTRLRRLTAEPCEEETGEPERAAAHEGPGVD